MVARDGIRTRGLRSVRNTERIWWPGTEAAGRLQEAGLTHYSRGHITVLDRPKLETRVCECYAVIKREMERLLPDKTAS